jgi:hypothetical protein
MKAPADWYEHFFSGLAVEFWRAVVPETATAEEAAFLWKHLSLYPGKRVLDVPCGHGRLSIPLAAKGCAVTGVDISEEFLRAAEDGARAAGVSLVWRRSDMRALPRIAAFDAAFAWAQLGYLDDAARPSSPRWRRWCPRALVWISGRRPRRSSPEAHLEAEIGASDSPRKLMTFFRPHREPHDPTDGRKGEKPSQRVYSEHVQRMLVKAGLRFSRHSSSSGVARLGGSGCSSWRRREERASVYQRNDADRAPAAFERDEAEVAGLDREVGQDQRPDQVQNQVRQRLGAKLAGLLRGERRQDHGGTHQGNGLSDHRGPPFAFETGGQARRP